MKTDLTYAMPRTYVKINRPSRKRSDAYYAKNGKLLMWGLYGLLLDLGLAVWIFGPF